MAILRSWEHLINAKLNGFVRSLLRSQKGDAVRAIVMTFVLLEFGDKSSYIFFVRIKKMLLGIFLASSFHRASLARSRSFVEKSTFFVLAWLSCDWRFRMDAGREVRHTFRAAGRRGGWGVFCVLCGGRLGEN